MPEAAVPASVEPLLAAFSALAVMLVLAALTTSERPPGLNDEKPVPELEPDAVGLEPSLAALEEDPDDPEVALEAGASAAVAVFEDEAPDAGVSGYGSPCRKQNQKFEFRFRKESCARRRRTLQDAEI